MNISIALIALIILFITMLYQIKIWKVRVLLSPGFYFSIIWILGLIGLLIFHSVNILIETYPKYIDELNILLAYTGICFILVTKIGVNKVNPSIININYFSTFRIFKMISIFYFLLALYVFVVEGSGFDFGKARDNMHETIENRSFLVGYFRLLSLPLSIYAGSKIIKILLKIEKTSIARNLFLILPFIADTLFSLTEGGRVAMVYGMLFYVVGAVLSVPLSFKVKEKKKIILYGVITLVFINSMISWVASVRSNSDGNTGTTEIIKEKLGKFSFLYGAIEYVNSSYVGYQYRRTDAVDSELGYGQYTFNGFINWQIPFAGRFGVDDASIAKALDIFYHNQETYDYSRQYYYVTHSAYIPIIKDFGFKGAFFAIIFIVYLSHIFFVKIQKTRSIWKSSTFFFYYLFFIYWTKSNFYGTLSESVLVPLYGFLIIDIINGNTKKKRAI